jgi:hypothetical protein
MSCSGSGGVLGFGGAVDVLIGFFGGIGTARVAAAGAAGADVFAVAGG